MACKKKAMMSKAARNGWFCPDPIPPETRVTLVYQDIVSPTAALNTWARQYRLTSLFDPDASGVGNQPLSFDEWMRLYLNYRVESASYVFECSTRTANGQISIACAPYAGGTVITDPEVIATLPLATTSSSMNGSEPAVCKRKIHASTVYGVPRNAIDTNEQFWGTSSTNPTLETILNVAATTSGATDVATYKIVIKFKVVFFRPGLVLLSAIRQKKKREIGSATRPPACTDGTDEVPASAGETVTLRPRDACLGPASPILSGGGPARGATAQLPVEYLPGRRCSCTGHAIQ